MPELAQVGLAERLDQEAALVPVHVGFEQDHVRELCRQAPHQPLSLVPYWRS